MFLPEILRDLSFAHRDARVRRVLLLTNSQFVKSNTFTSRPKYSNAASESFGQLATIRVTTTNSSKQKMLVWNEPSFFCDSVHWCLS